MNNRAYIQETVISWSLAFVLTWFGTSEILNPANWVSYVPSYLGSGSTIETLVIIHGIVLVLCALLLVLHIQRSVVAVVVALVLADIVVNLMSKGGVNPVSVRDIGLFGAAIALIFSHKKNSSTDAYSPTNQNRMTKGPDNGIFPEKYS